MNVWTTFFFSEYFIFNTLAVGVSASKIQSTIIAWGVHLPLQHYVQIFNWYTYNVFLLQMHPDSKFLGLGGQRSGLPLMEGQGHPMLGAQTPMSHHNPLPMMHPGMKSPLTPPGGPLELTVNAAHQRNNLGPDGRKFSLGEHLHLFHSLAPEFGRFWKTH